MATAQHDAVLPQPSRADIRIEQVLGALADPVRLLYVRELAQGPGAAVACGTVPIPVSKSTRTHHLRILREAGILTMHTAGTRRMVQLRREDLDAVYPGLLDAVLNAPH